jgi:hypothetical protein
MTSYSGAEHPADSTLQGLPTRERGSKVNPGSRWVIGGSPIFGGHPWVPAEN